MFPKGGDQVGDGARLSATQWNRHLEYAGNLLQQLPVPRLEDLKTKLLDLVVAAEETVAKMAEHAAESPEAHRGFVGHLFQYVAKQPVEAYGRKTLDTLTESFEESETNIRALVVEIAKVAALEGTAPQAEDAKQVARK